MKNWRFSTTISLYFEKDTTHGHSYNKRVIGTRMRRAGFKGGGKGPGPQASHRQRASHQTLHILFLAHYSCLRNYDLVLMHARVRHASARLATFIHQFIASVDQRLQFYKPYDYWLISLAALVACQHYPQKSY